MAKLTIIYHSRSGNTEAMAKAVQEGALAAGAIVNLKKAAEATVDDILDCDAVIFGSPNNFGYMAGDIKEILDQSFAALRDKEGSKPYAAFSSGGTQGGEPAITSIERVCSCFGGSLCKFKFEKAAEGVSTSRTPSSDVLEKCKHLGRKMATLQSVKTIG